MTKIANWVSDQYKKRFTDKVLSDKELKRFAGLSDVGLVREYGDFNSRIPGGCRTKVLCVDRLGDGHPIFETHRLIYFPGEVVRFTGNGFSTPDMWFSSSHVPHGDYILGSDILVYTPEGRLTEKQNLERVASIWLKTGHDSGCRSSYHYTGNLGRIIETKKRIERFNPPGSRKGEEVSDSQFSIEDLIEINIRKLREEPERKDVEGDYVNIGKFICGTSWRGYS